MSETEKATPPGWRERLRKIGKRAFLREEMTRLGFWPPDPETARKQQSVLAELKVRYEEIAQFREEMERIDREIAEVKDIPKLLADIRKRRIERVRAQRESRRQERERQAQEQRQQDAERRRRTPPHLGRGVSAGLRYEGGDPSRLAEMGLPILETATDLAAAIGITESELAWLTYHRGTARTDHYHRFTIPKRSGGERVISAPKRRLRVAQRWILETLLAPLPIHEAATAFRAGASIRQNAARHAAKAVVVRLDLEDFFPSISVRRVKGLFASFGYNEGIATLLALLATEPPRVAATLDGERVYVSVGQRQLPQGACTSPALTNLLCRALDRRLAGAAASTGFTYSRYADDLVFSHDRSEAPVGMLMALAGQIVTDEGFRLKEAKTAVMRPQHRQAVTGLVVNETPRVSRDDLRRFRAFLHHCQNEGFPAVSARLGRDARAHALGYLAFLHMVNPEQERKIREANPWLMEGRATGRE